MREVLATNKKIGGVFGGVRLQCFTFAEHDLNPTNANHEIIEFDDVQLLDRTATSFRVILKIDEINFTHARFVVESETPNPYSLFYEINTFKFLGGGAGDGRIEITFEFDPFTSLRMVKLSGIQTHARGFHHNVLTTPFESKREYIEVDLNALNLMPTHHHLVLKIVDRFDVIRSNVANNWTTSETITKQPSINTTIGKIISIRFQGGLTHFTNVLGRILDDLDTAYTVVDAWVTPYMPKSTQTIEHGGHTFLLHDMRPTTWETPFKADLSTKAISPLHNGGIGVGFSGTETFVDYKSINRQKISGSVGHIETMEFNLIYMPSTSSSTANKLVLTERRNVYSYNYDHDVVLATVEVPNIPFPLIDAPYQRYEKTSHYEQQVQFAETIVTAFGTALSSPNMSKGIFDAVMNLLTAGAYNLAQNADMKAQPVTLSNGSGGVESTVGEMYIVQKHVATRDIINRNMFTIRTELLRDIGPALEVKKLVDNETFESGVFFVNNTTPTYVYQPRHFYYVHGNFNATPINERVMINKAQSKKITEMLQQGVSFYGLHRPELGTPNDFKPIDEPDSETPPEIVDNTNRTFKLIDTRTSDEIVDNNFDITMQIGETKRYIVKSMSLFEQWNTNEHELLVLNVNGDNIEISGGNREIYFTATHAGYWQCGLQLAGRSNSIYLGITVEQPTETYYSTLWLTPGQVINFGEDDFRGQKYYHYGFPIENPAAIDPALYTFELVTYGEYDEENQPATIDSNGTITVSNDIVPIGDYVEIYIRNKENPGSLTIYSVSIYHSYGGE